MPDYVINCENESKYLLDAIETIISEIRRKGAPFELDLTSDKFHTSSGGVVGSTPASASSGGALPSAPASASETQDRSHSGLYDPQAGQRQPAHRLTWLVAKVCVGVVILQGPLGL